MRILKDVEMKEYSHMKVGGTAKELIFIENRNEFKEVLSTRDRVYFLGNGTNTLIDDGYLDISFISLKNFQNITVEEKTDEYDLVRVEAGLDLDDLIDYMEKNDYTGLENITGIPGSVGGLVNMNGGAYGTEIFDCIEEVEICDSEGEIRKLKKSELSFKYRTTEIKEKNCIILGKEDWHHGVIGIVSSKITEKFNKPSILLCFENNIAKGSGRSVPGFDLYKAISSTKEYLLGFGGHTMACGLSLTVENFERFKKYD